MRAPRRSGSHPLLPRGAGRSGPGCWKESRREAGRCWAGSSLDCDPFSLRALLPLAQALEFLIRVTVPRVELDRFLVGLDREVFLSGGRVRIAQARIRERGIGILLHVELED